MQERCGDYYHSSIAHGSYHATMEGERFAVQAIEATERNTSFGACDEMVLLHCYWIRPKHTSIQESTSDVSRSCFAHGRDVYTCVQLTSELF